MERLNLAVVANVLPYDAQYGWKNVDSDARRDGTLSAYRGHEAAASGTHVKNPLGIRLDEFDQDGFALRETADVVRAD